MRLATSLEPEVNSTPLTKNNTPTSSMSRTSSGRPIPQTQTPPYHNPQPQGGRKLCNTCNSPTHLANQCPNRLLIKSASITENIPEEPTEPAEVTNNKNDDAAPILGSFILHNEVLVSKGSLPTIPVNKAYLHNNTKNANSRTCSHRFWSYYFSGQCFGVVQILSHETMDKGPGENG